MSYKTGKGSGSIHGWSTTRTRPQPHDPGVIFGARLVYWALLVCTLVGIAAACRADDRGPDIRPFFGYTHISDIMRGPPFGPPVEGCEPTTDWAGAGVTFAWSHVQVDFAHGIKQRDAWCGRPWAQPRESGTEVAIRWYPFRPLNRP